MWELQHAEPERIRCYVMINPNDRAEAACELELAARNGGAAGIKLAASRRANDSILDEFMAIAAGSNLPVLHHVWQHRRHEWPGQEASDAAELAELASRHPRVNFILAHIGGGGDYAHTFSVAREIPNLLLDLSGSGVDRGMIDAALEAVGPERLLWGSDVTMETGLAKLRALDHVGLEARDIERIRWRNAVRIFPEGTFPMIAER
jgi:predicted TIM-barrel fold metal-dependent hydrolase